MINQSNQLQILSLSLFRDEFYIDLKNLPNTLKDFFSRFFLRLLCENFEVNLPSDSLSSLEDFNWLSFTNFLGNVDFNTLTLP